MKFRLKFQVKTALSSFRIIELGPEALMIKLLSGTLYKNYLNLHVAVHHTVTNLEKGVCITNVCYPSSHIEVLCRKSE